MRSIALASALTLLAALPIACTPTAPLPSPTAPTTTPATGGAAPATNDHGHSHEKNKMLIADAGDYHFLLTAHLAKAANELDIFVETPVNDNAQPVALPLKSFTAQATVGDGEAQTLTFEPAPSEERPAGEGDDKCSHFVAKAGWMRPEDTLYVVARITVDGRELTARWENFLPSKYAHHHE
ncbi:MAG TPA: hypothetical protein VM165_13430 [Planctomycetaceae bacterium]|nr:hypothetical protein [Planctomycetaceae bacterium]